MSLYGDRSRNMLLHLSDFEGVLQHTRRWTIRVPLMKNRVPPTEKNAENEDQIHSPQHKPDDELSEGHLLNRSEYNSTSPTQQQMI